MDTELFGGYSNNAGQRGGRDKGHIFETFSVIRMDRCQAQWDPSILQSSCDCRLWNTLHPLLIWSTLKCPLFFQLRYHLLQNLCFHCLENNACEILKYQSSSRNITPNKSWDCTSPRKFFIFLKYKSVGNQNVLYRNVLFC